MLGAFAALMLVSGYYMDNRRINPSAFILNRSKLSRKVDDSDSKESNIPLGHLVELSLIEDSKIVLFLRSMINYHRWLSVFLSYNELQPRVYRVTSLIGYLFILMFGNTLAFQVSNSSMGCYDMTTRDACESEPSPVSDGSNCVWNEDAWRCEPRAHELVGVLYLALICAIFTIPLTVIQDYLVDKVLRAQVMDTDDVRNQGSGVAKAYTFKRIAASMAAEIVAYRSGLSAIDGAEFDDMWGTVPVRSTDGATSYSLPKYVQSQLLRDLKHVEQQRAEEILVSKQHQKNIDLQITRLFVKDLLPYTASVVLSAVHRHENESRVISTIRSRWWKVVSWGYLFATNCMILVYMMIYALQQDRLFQVSWLRTLFVSLSGDVLILSTLVIYFNHVYVPQLFLSDAQSMTSGIKSMFDDGKNVIYDTMEQFAANKYLFVSHWLASAHPSSKVSSIVLNYSTPWPRRSYKRGSINGVSIVAILMLFEVIMGLPSSLQNELCKFILLAFLANIATSELWQQEYRTWVKIAVALFVLTVLYVIGRLLGYVLRRVSGRYRWSRPVATAGIIHHSDAAMPLLSPPSLSPSVRRVSLHVTRRASAAQALEALQQVAGAVSVSVSENKGSANRDVTTSNIDSDSDDEDYYYWKSSDFSESTIGSSTATTPSGPRMQSKNSDTGDTSQGDEESALSSDTSYVSSSSAYLPSDRCS
jgi:chromate transport protein ChrA